MLRTSATSTPTLQQTYYDIDMFDYWFAYNERLPTTTPASLALYAGVKGFVAEHAIPRFINTAGDLKTNVNWSVNDTLVDTNRFKSTFEREEKMVDRNWTTPFQVRETLRERRTEKACLRV